MDEQKNPWTITGEKDIYSNPWIAVTEYQVLNPNGGKGIYGKVHFKNHAIGIVALDEDLNTYLVGQYRFPLNQYSWEIPEGGAPLDADKLEAAQRELLEETGLKAQHWEKVLEVHLSNSVCDEAGTIYVATGLSQHTPMPDDTEQLAIKKVPFEEVYHQVATSRITDLISVAAILRVKLMLINGDIQARYMSVE